MKAYSLNLVLVKTEQVPFTLAYVPGLLIIILWKAGHQRTILMQVVVF